MNRLSLDSSTIKGIGYDAKSSILEIEFHTGEIRQYDEVPLKIFQKLLTSSSHGGYFISNIKNKFKYRKVAEADWIMKSVPST